MTNRELLTRVKGLAGAELTRAIIESLQGLPVFERIADEELKLLEHRDREDEYKLKEGIAIAAEKGLLPSAPGHRDWERIAVDGKSPGEVYDELMTLVRFDSPGTVLLICGNSGVGKGTLVDELIARTPGAECWSNGDIFRVFTWFVLNGIKGGFTPEAAADADYSAIRKRIRIKKGSDIQVLMSEGVRSLDSLKNGVLKEKAVNLALPSVARYIQGEVIGIVNEYLAMNTSRHLVLEGRKETLNYINGDYRAQLVLNERGVLGERRAAQKIAGLLECYEGENMEIEQFLAALYK
ncbi:MAG: hypothetical protein JXB03_01910 [Spirochaetales bacterium]|nr:hypothetical protein [Spirochaetales bacterium]